MNEKYKLSYLIKIITYIILGLFIYNSYLSITQYQNPDVSGTGGISFVAIIMILVVSLSAVELFINIKKNRLNSIVFWGFLYLLFAIISTLLSGNFSPYRLIFRCVEIGYWICVFTIFYYSVRHYKKIEIYYVVYSVAFIVLFLMFITMAMSKNGHTLLLNPIYYLMFASPMLLLIKKKFIRYVFLLLLFIGVILSYKRSAMISLLFAIIVYFYYDSKSQKKSWKSILTTILVVLFVTLIGYYVFTTLSETLNLDWLSRMESLRTDGGSGRADIWKNVIHYFFTESPLDWIFGYGYQGAYLFGAAHNDLLEILFDFGFIGIIAYVRVLISIAKYFFRMKKYNYSNYPAFAFSLVVFVGGTMFSQVVIYPYWFIGMVIFWAIIIADYDNLKEKKRNENIVACQHDAA